MNREEAHRLAKAFKSDLAQKVAEFGKIVEAACNSVIITDRSGRLLLVNRAARQFVSRKSDHVLDAYLQNILPSAWKDMQPVFQTATPQKNKRVTFRQRTILANHTPLFTGGRVAAVLSIFQDTAGYEKVCSDLEGYKQLNAQLDVIIDSSYDGMWICDAKGKVLRINPASEKLSGVKEADVIGRNMEDLLDEGLFDKSATLEVLKSQRSRTLIQTLKDGRQILVTGTPVRNSDGDIRIVVVNARDISELNRLHTELEKSKALNFHYCSELNFIKKYREVSSEFVIRSESMQRIFETAMRVARVDSSVLITGESGTGKNLIAEIIHQSSERRTGSMIRINCGAIPESLIEAELFGYESGAFTGAHAKGKPGQFEMAHQGTLFLDEVGELPLNMQVKLLRFLEDKEIVRIGATTPRRLDVRVVAATNRDLKKMVASGEFRNDLFFRLNVVPLKIPPLRRRVEDIPALIHFFLKKYNQKFQMKKALTPAAIDSLCNYSFPGNIRELANIMERLVLLSSNEQIGLTDLPKAVRKSESRPPFIPERGSNLNETLKQVESRLIVNALKASGSQRKAAKMLKINHTTLSRKIKRLGIHNDDVGGE
mgnify:CR=1 FL=1